MQHGQQEITYQELEDAADESTKASAAYFLAKAVREDKGLEDDSIYVTVDKLARYLGIDKEYNNYMISSHELVWLFQVHLLPDSPQEEWQERLAKFTEELRRILERKAQPKHPNFIPQSELYKNLEKNKSYIYNDIINKSAFVKGDELEEHSYEYIYNAYNEIINRFKQ